MFPIDFFWRAAQRWPDRIAIDAPEGAIRYDALAAHIVKDHPYDEPALWALPMVKGSESFLRWIDAESSGA